MIKGFFYIKLKQFTLNTSFIIPNRGITFIIGESGSGKTTLLKCITGLIKPTKGYIKINNKCLQNHKYNIFIPPEKRNIGLIFQDPYLFPNMTGLENLQLGYKKYNTNNYINIKKIINFLKLTKVINRNVLTLSGGEKQRLAIGQTLLTNPKILLMDEPFSSQDIIIKKNIISHLKIINRQLAIPIICVSHTIKDIYNLGNYLLYMHKGKILYTEKIKQYI